MSEMIQEFVDSGSQRLRVDRKAGVIRGVKLLGLTSRNGRRYRERALAEAICLYEGAKVNVNHPKGHPLSPRDYQDRLGMVRGVDFRAGEGLFGDLHFNPRHSMSEQLIWDAEHAPQNVGMSHNVLARTSRSGEETIVEAITKVQSIDLVADPATTDGLYEQSEISPAPPDESKPAQVHQWDALAIEELRLHRPDLVSEIERSVECQLESMRGELETFTAREAAIKRRERIAQLLEQSNLPIPGGQDHKSRLIVSDRFIQSLMDAPDDTSLKQLVEERAELVRWARSWDDELGLASRRPRSRDQLSVLSPARARAVQNAKDFAAAVRG